MATDGSATRTTPSLDAVVSAATPHRQRRMGPAPFASFEDLSDEVRSRLESPDEKTPAGSVVRLPGIREDITPSSPGYNMSHTPDLVYTGISLVGQVRTPVNPSTSFAEEVANFIIPSAAKLQAPHTPRIDISRASSSSHHDSKDSSPEKEIAGEKYANDSNQGITKLGVGFREDGTLDLRSSTEELDFQDQKEQERRKNRSRPQSPSCLYEDSYQNHIRKDSQCSEIGLLSISGRTSRLSSIGSAGSAHSGQSRLSNASHLSVLSGGTEISRSPSPHKMLLETSFCGTKSPQSMSSVAIDEIGTKIETDDLEKILLSRKHDPTEAILAEGITMKTNERSFSLKQAPEKPARKIEKRVQSVKNDITIKVDSPSITPTGDKSVTPRSTKRIVADSGTEYIYIPLKGPLPLDYEEHKSSSSTQKIPSSSSRSGSKSTSNAASKSKKPSSAPSKLATASAKSKRTTEAKTEEIPCTSRVISSAPVQKRNEPKYIRIKLKPDHLYDDDDTSNTSPEIKADKIDLDEIRTDDSTTGTCDTGKSFTSSPSVSPKFSRHGVARDLYLDSKTPSPSLSRKSSFTSIFRSKEAITSPESPTVPGKRKNTITGILREASESLRDRSRSRSRSKSRERDRSLAVSNAPSSTESIDSRGKQKGVFSIFRSKGDIKKSEKSSPEIIPDKMAKVEFKFNEAHQKKPDKLAFEKPLEANSIRIPLHSPTHYENENHRLLKDVQTPSQDSQDTVIEVAPVKKKEIQDNTNHQVSEIVTRKNVIECQSSTSSENVVFSTKVDNNEVFTTKLPKNKPSKIHEKIEESKYSNGHVPMDSSLESNPEAGTIIIEKVQIETTRRGTVEKKVEENPKPETKLERTRSTTSLIKMAEENQKPIIREDEFKPEKSKAIKTKPSKDEEKQDSSDSESSVTLTLKNLNSRAEADANALSESEMTESVTLTSKKFKKEAEATQHLEPEFTSLVQQESFEDELPYVPTTLPLERSAAVPIVPVKQRSTFEMKTCPIDRPRSTTPINPSSLEDYCDEVVGNINTENLIKSIEKLKISLPRCDSADKGSKSPKKPQNTTWMEFAEKGILTGRKSSTEGDTPPPLPPKGAQKEWINFEEVPERRKLPKRIQTIPSRGHIDVPDNVLHDHVVYNYVNPDECKCECHEKKDKKKDDQEEVTVIQDDEIPLLENDLDDEKPTNSSLDKTKFDNKTQKKNLIADSANSSVVAEKYEMSDKDASLGLPFTTDLEVSSTISSIMSQEYPNSP